MKNLKKSQEPSHKSSLEEMLVLGLQLKFTPELGNTLVVKGSKNGNPYYSLSNTVPDYDLNIGRIVTSEEFMGLHDSNPLAYTVILSVMKRGNLSDLFFSESTSQEQRERGRRYFLEVLKELGLSDEEIKRATISYAQRQS
ncbi:MAG: hypothetical protein KGH71_01285 [Candidatus Micrarchaeota archaeon]|nr:hypothetical protein [Candidatus Micrarchaeota archaeon]